MPWEFTRLTYTEFIEIYEARMKLIKLQNDLDNRRTARICCLIANIHAKKGKKFNEDDFIPGEKEKNKQDVKSMETTLKAITMIFGGEVE